MQKTEERESRLVSKITGDEGHTHTHTPIKIGKFPKHLLRSLEWRVGADLGSFLSTRSNEKKNQNVNKIERFSLEGNYSRTRRRQRRRERKERLQGYLEKQ